MNPLDPEQFDDVIHQAEGVLSARLGVSVEQAAMILSTTMEKMVTVTSERERSRRQSGRRQPR